jgi:excisionase family DNA binding protein
METTQINWVSKEEAGVLLGSIGRPLSNRRVLELAKEGKIESGRSVDPNNGQTVYRIHAGSIERYLDKKRNPAPIPPPAKRTEPWTAADGLTKRVSELVGLAKLLRQEPTEEGEPQRGRLWLTLEEAADYSGLPAAAIVHFIESKALKALNVGRRRGGQWRIRRLDLDQFAG